MKKTLCLVVMLFLMSLSFINSFGQVNNQNEPSTTYKIYTHTVVGSNNSAGKTKLPVNLTKAFEDIKNNFNYSNYQLLSSQFQLIKHKGAISYNSVLKSSDFIDNADAPIFANWVYQGLNEENINGTKQIGFKTFKFEMKFPMKNWIVAKDNTPASTILYEKLGLTAFNIDFPIGKPVVFASFPIEMSDKALFFLVHLEELN